MEERTGWRDQAISERHRTYGYNLPAVDIDFLLVEYDRGIACAVIDYKQMQAPVPNRDSPNMRAISSMRTQDGHQMPFFVVRYERVGWTYVVHGMNPAAMMVAEQIGVPLGDVLLEQDYIKFLLRLRGYK